MFSKISVALSFALMTTAPALQGQSLIGKRDASAIQMVQASMTAMGGRSAWSSITSMHTEWQSLGQGAASSVVTEQFDDDWSRGFVVFNHVSKDSQGQHVFSGDANHNVEEREPSTITTLPAKLQELALPWYVPAATLFMELSNPQYQITMLQGAGPEPKVVIAKVVRPGSIDEFTRQVWTFNSTSSLPEEVVYRTESVHLHRPVEQALQFSGYAQHGAFSVPSVVVADPTGKPEVSQLTAFSAK